MKKKNRKTATTPTFTKKDIKTIKTLKRNLEGLYKLMDNAPAEVVKIFKTNFKTMKRDVKGVISDTDKMLSQKPTTTTTTTVKKAPTKKKGTPKKTRGKRTPFKGVPTAVTEETYV